MDNVKLAHRICNRMHAASSAGLSTKGDLARVAAAREGARDGSWARRVGWSSEIAAVLCGSDVALVRSFIGELRAWPDVEMEAFFDRGAGPTGLQLMRGSHRFANIFPRKSLQFAHGGRPLTGLDLTSEQDVGPTFQSIAVKDLDTSFAEARLLAAYAYWVAG